MGYGVSGLGYRVEGLGFRLGTGEGVMGTVTRIVVRVSMETMGIYSSNAISASSKGCKFVERTINNSSN